MKVNAQGQVEFEPQTMSLEDSVELVATYLATSVPRHLESQFDEVECRVATWGGDDLERLHCADGAKPAERDPSIYSEDETRRLRRVVDAHRIAMTPIDVTSFNRGTNAHEFVLCRWRQLRPSEYRGRVPFRPCVLGLTTARLTEAGDYTATETGFAGYRGQWHDLYPSGPHLRWQPGLLAEEAMWAALIHVFRERDWRVVVGYQGHSRVSFEMGPAGIQEMFRLRDIPEGRSRRAALKHWVRGHWRKKHGAEDAAKVREHLRGGTEFTWNGLRCSVRLPPLEIDPYRPAVEAA